MSRQLTGSKKQTTHGWQASLPLHRGAAKRSTWTFVDEPAADRWIAAGRAAIEAGERVPTPTAREVTGRSGPGAALGTRFASMADTWCQENYEEMRRGGGDREVTVRGHIRRISTFMDERGLTMETMRRDQVKDLQASLTRTLTASVEVRVPDGLDPDALVTMNQAVALPDMASRSTLKRRITEGQLSAAQQGPTGHLFRVGDLYREAVLGGQGPLRPGPRRSGGLSQNVAADVMWVFDQVCLFAEDHGVVVPQDRKSLKMHKTDRQEAPERQIPTARSPPC